MKSNTFVFPIVRRDYILDALKSLGLVTPPNYQTIVVDQTKPDGEFEVRLQRLCDVHIKTRKNYGFAQATNIGFRFAQHTDKEYIAEIYRNCTVTMMPNFDIGVKYLTACNDDVVFIWPGWWDGIIETFKRYDTAICVNPMSPKEPGWGYGEEGFREHLSFRESIDPKNIERLIEEKNGQMIDGLVCWCSTFKREVLVDEIGLFDERFWPGAGEDYDLMGRIYQAGYRALATSLSWVWHWWGQSKDERDGFRTALPAAREQWNKLNILWEEGFDVWGYDPETRKPFPRDSIVARMPL